MNARSGLRRIRVLAVAVVLVAGLSAEASADFTNNLFVADLNNKLAFGFDIKTGASNGSFGGANLTGPRGIAVGPDNNVYVSDVGTKSVVEFNGATGAFIKTFVSSGSGGLNFPYGMMFGPDGNLYVSSQATNQVLEYNGSTGAFIKAIGAGSPLNSPIGLAFGPNGDLFVASSMSSNGQVLEFNPTTGTYVGVFGPGVQQVSGLAFGNGVFYVASGIPGGAAFDVRNATNGSIITSINDPAHLNTIGGLVVGADTKLYIASYGTGNVVRYNADGTFDKIFVTGSSVGMSGPIYLALGVPEPSSMALLAIGAFGLAGVALRRKAWSAA